MCNAGYPPLLVLRHRVEEVVISVWFVLELACGRDDHWLIGLYEREARYRFLRKRERVGAL